MNVDQRTILMRIKRKAEILCINLKATNDTKQHDAAEILLLIDLMEKS